MADLISLAEFKTAVDVDVTDTRHDLQYSQAISNASRAILNYTGRDFGTATTTEERVFDYDGSGYLDIDDAASVSQVSVATFGFPDYVLTPDQWMAMPFRRDDSPVFYYLVIPGGWQSMSPAMGFTRNLDVMASEGRLVAAPDMVKVTATWGWPLVPEDVQQAVIWTVQEWTSRPKGEQLTGESIASYSRSWGGRTGDATAQAIPNKARDLLAQYIKQLT